MAKAVQAEARANCTSFFLHCCSLVSVDVSAGAGLTEEEREDAQLSLTPHDILRKLPGVTATNIRGLLQQVNNLRELSEATLKQLTQWMGGAVAAKKLYTFMHGERHKQPAMMLALCDAVGFR